MKAFTNICAAIGRFFNRKREQIKTAIAEYNQPQLVRSITDPKHIYICSGAPIPMRMLNQRQRRKLVRQTR